MTIDVAIVGGSYAGLSAALPLGRARRQVTVFDTGERRNRVAARSHGFLAQDGRSPAAIVADARAQLARYDTVQWREGRVTSLAGAKDGFVLTVDGMPQVARRVILALGVADALPAIPGLAERWGSSVFHCPYCHGFELQRGAVAVIATGPLAVHQAQLLTEWGQVTLFLQGALALGEDDASRLAGLGVAVEATPVARLVGHADVVLADGRRQAFAGVFTAPRTRPAAPLASMLGCEHVEGPTGPYVKTGATQETSVPGVFACGDVARPAGNVALAAGEGALAGSAAHASLVFTD
ncbi:NAD(P)/FAD-dependent oxidoreductase [Ideonella sp.]|uniref:NAD(P)/FAD-dependent oxidoreductase n=1 Tax=Ideonella sp. TaxID=1929293 RepID=UPI0035B44D66